VSTVPERTILHADMDAFYAAIEQRDRPELRGKPVIVGGSGPRTVVSTASYEARRYGVHSAMPGVQAKRRCPHGIFVAPRMEAYAAEAARIRAVFERFTDLVEPLSLDEAFLDVTGSRALFGDGAAIARRLKEAVLAATQLTVSVGVATSKYVAKVASDLRKPDGLVVVPAGTEREFLAPLPVGRLWGAGPKTEQLLRRAGLATIGDLQRLSPAQLAAAVGEHAGAHFWALANGVDPRPVEPERQAQSIGHEMTFAADLQTRDEVRAVLLQLSEMVGRRLRQHGLRGHLVRLKLRYPDFRTITRQRKVQATDDDLVLFRTAGALLRENWPGQPGIRLLGITAGDLAPAAGSAQRELFARGADKASEVLRAMDAIRERFGEDAIHHGLERRSTTPFGPIEPSGGD
jgi:DNA polymerase-4